MQEKMIKLFKLTDSTTIYEIESESDFLEFFNLTCENILPEVKLRESEQSYTIYPGRMNSQIKIKNITDNYDYILLKSYLNPKIHYQEYYDCNDHKVTVIKNMKRKCN